jgi:beta-glucanase (GH16 family)
MNIKNIKLFSLIILATITLNCSSDDKQQVVNHYTKLVMAEEFNTNGPLNPAIWNFDIGTGNNGWGNNEFQYYTNRPENIRIENGRLLITAIKENYMGASHTSARINTKGKFEKKYGRFEARMKMPWGRGLWPAFWLLGSNIDQVSWPKCGEIDIMEYRGQEPTKTHGSIHGPGYFAGQAITKSYTLPNDRFDTGFHVFGIEWGADFINYYVDNVLFFQIKKEDVTGEWVFDQPFYIILNLAVGGGFVGNPNAETQFPQTLEIDYIRFYE